jgi:hypothetical protein
MAWTARIQNYHAEIAAARKAFRQWHHMAPERVVSRRPFSIPAALTSRWSGDFFLPASAGAFPR